VGGWTAKETFNQLEIVLYIEVAYQKRKVSGETFLKISFCFYQIFTFLPGIGAVAHKSIAVGIWFCALHLQGHDRND